MTPTGILFVDNFKELAARQIEAGIPVQSEGGVGSSHSSTINSPNVAEKAPTREPQTRMQAEATKQNEPSR